MTNPNSNPRIKVGTTIIFAGTIVFVYACAFAVIQKDFPNWQYLVACSLLLLTGIAVHRNYVFAGILYPLTELASILVTASITLIYGIQLANPFFIIPMLLNPVALLIRIATIVLPILFVLYLIRNQYLFKDKFSRTKSKINTSDKKFDIFNLISSVNQSFKKAMLTSKGPTFTSTNLSVTIAISITVIVIIYSILKSPQ